MLTDISIVIIKVPKEGIEPSLQKEHDFEPAWASTCLPCWLSLVEAQAG